LAVSDIIDKDDAVSSFVVGSSDGLEAFLAGGVPDLQFDCAAVGFECSNLEVYTDGG
jgi:hypothetical protein